MRRLGRKSDGELKRAPSPRPSPIRWEREAIGRVRASFGGPARFHGAGFLSLRPRHPARRVFRHTLGSFRAQRSSTSSTTASARRSTSGERNDDTRPLQATARRGHGAADVTVALVFRSFLFSWRCAAVWLLPQFLSREGEVLRAAGVAWRFPCSFPARTAGLGGRG